MNKKKVLVIHGPNLELLGKREPEIYGSMTLEEINRKISEKASKAGLEAEIFQSNHEGEIVDRINKTDCAAVIINPAAFTHTSVAVLDALRSFNGIIIEVHLSNIFSRESYRKESITASAASGMICGFRENSYLLAIDAVAGLV